ncbi:WxL domain-containing protein [Enterococcus faecalis]|uniref:WxL domain-containing protein n=6 Tax=Enterococcus TaxID=1350 RepID=UPI003D2D003F
MKQTKWQRLATIGLCSSLVMNAFSGVTAVAETVTIESSPTAESSAKEETQASSVKEETTKASRENSQETTDTSQEEATEEAEKQAETEVKEEQKEEPQAEVEQAEPPANSSENDLQKSISPRWVPNNQSIYPRMIFNFTDETGKAFADENLTLSGTYYKLARHIETKQWCAYADRYPIVSSNAGGGQYRVAVNAAISVPYDFLTNVPAGYDVNIYAIEQLKIDNTLKYVDSIVTQTNTISMTRYSNQQVSETPQFGNYTNNILTQRDRIFSKNSASIFSLNSVAFTTNVLDVVTIMRTDGIRTNSGMDLLLLGFDGTPTYRETLNYKVTRKQVTEKFVDANGVAITPPTGFTQSKKTPMTSNAFTFKQAGTLPDTYTTGGKTYKFKGWYKGKTKPSTLTTTKAPSYAVTYDGNDDLNVVYEEVNFPAVTYQFGFVNEAGQLVNPADIKITYDYKSIAFRGTGGTGSTVSFGTLATNQSGSTVGKLKEVTLPTANIARPTATGWNGDAFSNFSIKLPRYYQSLNLYDKTGKINPNYPLPTMTAINSVGGNVDMAAAIIANLTLTQRADKSYTLREQVFPADSTNLKLLVFLIRSINSSNLASGNTNYKTVGSPIYYHLTNRKVTENFVDTNGAKITPPTGFTQGKQTAITSDPYTFKQAGTLPDSYTTGGKTYKFKGWYKGKSKTEPLKTTKAPSYGVTYDDNDDLNVVYEETNFPAVTYQFGFVSEAGQLVNPADIKITYDYKSVDYRRATSAFSYGTIADNQSAPTVGNLKNVTFPETYIARPTEGGWNGEAYSNFSIKLPRYYQSLNLYDKTNKINPNYPLPVITQNYSASDNVVLSETAAISLLTATQRPDQSYTPKEQVSGEGRYPTLLRRLISSIDVASGSATYQTLSGPVYYHLTNRRVTENFVDTNGAKITPPTGFTQGKQTVINSDPYTFKQAGTLPDTYTTGGKTYKFKGWYKGKTKTEPLTTTKAPSYGVTYDGNDDLNVVYEEETVTTFYPSVNMNFVNETGGTFTPALTFSGKYYVRRTSDNVITNLYDVTSKSKGNGQYTVSINNGSIPLSQELFKKYTNGSLPIVPNALAFRLDKLAIDQQLKYVDSIQVEAAQSSGLNVYGYDYTNSSSTIIDSSVAPTVSNLSTADINGLNFKTDGTNFSNTSFRFLGMTIGSSMNSTGSYLFFTNLFSNNPTNDSKLVYKVTRKQVTENFVDANGAKITAPTGFTQGNQVPMTSNTFKYTAAKALPATYTTDGKTYTFQGWYKGKTKPSTLNKTTTPTFNATFDGNDDMTAMYKEEIPTASVTLTRPKEVIDTNTNVIWTTTITNTSKAPLQNLTLKKGPNWSVGLTIPTFMEVTPEGGTTKSIPVNSTLWTEGVPLPNAVPIGKKVSVAFTTRATGKPNTVLKAEVVVFGGIKDRAVDNFVRIRPNDQEVVTPTTEGFISVPTFDFGQVGVAGSKQQHSLKQAADYYGNGTRNPYLRIKKTQPNWSLTAQLSQPKSATDSLPTATRLLLGAAPVSSFTNYNQPTELKNAVGTTSAISLTANNTATSIIANKQFTGSNVYQLDFTFNNVKLEVPANQGVKGQQYKAAVTWNLVTGP